MFLEPFAVFFDRTLAKLVLPDCHQETLVAHRNLEFQLFESQSYGESDLLFKDATRCLVHSTHLDYRAILGEEFYRAAEAVFNCTYSGEFFIIQLSRTLAYICYQLKYSQRWYLSVKE